jgi:hypothetical protein
VINSYTRKWVKPTLTIIFILTLYRFSYNSQLKTYDRTSSNILYSCAWGVLPWLILMNDELLLSQQILLSFLSRLISVRKFNVVCCGMCRWSSIGSNLDGKVCFDRISHKLNKLFYQHSSTNFTVSYS